MSSDPLGLLVIGAHPDDADVRVGGLAAQWAANDRRVCFVSLTNGDAGHHEIGGVELARRRRAESEAAADVIGIDYRIFDIHDGELMPTLANRRAVIRLIREFDPDLVITHRPYDYHPDHRYTARLVRDAAYMVTVPNICPHTPALDRNPVIGYMYDGFERPVAFRPDVVYAIDDVIDEKLEMLHQHESQMYEWLPYNKGNDEPVPTDEDERREWLREWRVDEDADVADDYRPQLRDRYGPHEGNTVGYAEAVEISEYGRAMDADEAEAFFPE